MEEQCEDVGRDMKPYLDADGNAYDSAFGLDYCNSLSQCLIILPPFLSFSHAILPYTNNYFSLSSFKLQLII